MLSVTAELVGSLSLVSTQSSAIPRKLLIYQYAQLTILSSHRTIVFHSVLNDNGLLFSILFPSSFRSIGHLKYRQIFLKDRNDFYSLLRIHSSYLFAFYACTKLDGLNRASRFNFRSRYTRGISCVSCNLVFVCVLGKRTLICDCKIPSSRPASIFTTTAS